MQSRSLSSKYLCIESWPPDSYRIAFSLSLLLVQCTLPLVCLTVSQTSVYRSINGGLSSKENSLEENEIISLTLHHPKSGTQVKLSTNHGWSYLFTQKHRRRYSKKTAVLPAPVTPPQENHLGMLSHFGSTRSPFSLSTKIIPGVCTCFEIEAEENSDTHEIRVNCSIRRIKKRSQSVFHRLIILILAFAVNWRFLHLFHGVTDFHANLISDRHFKSLYCICHSLEMMSYCLNPILYGFLNNGIKADLISLMHCLQMSEFSLLTMERTNVYSIFTRFKTRNLIDAKEFCI
ncbi:LOW QUALITY PROTEIN: neuropeptide Y receptor type 5 [Rhynchocyon petersi]